MSRQYNMKFIDVAAFADLCVELNALTVSGCDSAIDGIIFAFTSERRLQLHESSLPQILGVNPSHWRALGSIALTESYS